MGMQASAGSAQSYGKAADFTGVGQERRAEEKGSHYGDRLCE
jgi:hypothetical protein